MTRASVPRRGRPVAFVLSGGGSLGAAQMGVLRALYERGIIPDFRRRAKSLYQARTCLLAGSPLSPLLVTVTW